MPEFSDDPRLTAFALGEHDPADGPEFEALLARDPAARALVDDVRATARLLTDQLRAEPSPTGLSPDRLRAIEGCFAPMPARRRPSRLVPIGLALAAGLLAVAVGLKYATEGPRFAQGPPASVAKVETPSAKPEPLALAWDKPEARRDAVADTDANSLRPADALGRAEGPGLASPMAPPGPASEPMELAKAPGSLAPRAPVAASKPDASPPEPGPVAGRPAAVAPRYGYAVGAGGQGELPADSGAKDAKLASAGDPARQPHAKSRGRAKAEEGSLDERQGVDKAKDVSPEALGDALAARAFVGKSKARVAEAPLPAQVQANALLEAGKPGGDAFAPIEDNPFRVVFQDPTSTFSVDVDTASYANVRRYLSQGMRPPRDAVRIEELVNYFAYAYPQPKGDDPFSVNVEVARCPWEADHRLVRIGLKGREVARDARPPSNLVFLIDVSGSMNDLDKLPMLKAGLKLMVGALGENDRVAIVVYAAAEGLALASTPCTHKGEILSALDQLQAGGSTDGGKGIVLAYDQAVGHFIKGGTNRVILATDGDFNVGITDPGELDRLIEAKRATGVFLSVLGVGQGNVKHDRLERLADRGNGQYCYIDSIAEARRVLVDGIAGTLVTIAKDVKVQVEFNPARAGAYRLLGYENRMLKAEDFADDKKDAGEIGAGHTVTALYQVAPPMKGGKGVVPQAQNQLAIPANQASPELLEVRLRCKAPAGDVSQVFTCPVQDVACEYSAATADFKLASSVAGLGMMLRDSPHKGNLTWPGLVEMAQAAVGLDAEGYRKEFLDLVRKAQASPAR